MDLTVSGDFWCLLRFIGLTDAVSAGVRLNRLDSEYKEVKLHIYFNEKFNPLKQCYKHECKYNLTCFNIKNLHLIPSVCMCFLRVPAETAIISVYSIDCLGDGAL